MKKSKTIKTSHTSPKKIGMGDHYGQGMKNPMGRMRDSFVGTLSKSKNTKKPPRSLA